MAYNVGAVLGSVKFDVRDAVVNVNNFKNALNDIPRSTQPATRAISNLSQVAVPVSAALAAVGASGLLLARHAVQAAGQMESYRASFIVLTGSVSAAEARIRQLVLFAAKTPFDLPGVIEADRLVQAFRLDVGGMEKTLTAFGDAAAGMGVPIQEVIPILAKLKAGMFEIEQMARLGITRDALREFGIQFTKTGEVINRQDLFPAAMKLLERFTGTMERQMETLGGRMSNMRDAIFQLSAAMGTGLLPFTKQAIGAITQLTGSLQTWAEANKALAASIGMVLSAGSLLLVMVGGLGLVIGPVEKGFAALVGTVKALRIAWVAITSLLVGVPASWVLLAGAIVLVGSHIASLAKRHTEAQTAAAAHTAEMRKLAEAALELAAKKDRTAAETDKLSEAMAKLKAEYPELLRFYSDEAKAVEHLTFLVGILNTARTGSYEAQLEAGQERRLSYLQTELGLLEKRLAAEEKAIAATRVSAALRKDIEAGIRESEKTLRPLGLREAIPPATTLGEHVAAAMHLKEAIAEVNRELQAYSITVKGTPPKAAAYSAADWQKEYGAIKQRAAIEKWSEARTLASLTILRDAHLGWLKEHRDIYAAIETEITRIAEGEAQKRGQVGEQAIEKELAQFEAFIDRRKRIGDPLGLLDIRAGFAAITERHKAFLSKYEEGSNVMQSINQRRDQALAEGEEALYSRKLEHLDNLKAQHLISATDEITYLKQVGATYATTAAQKEEIERRLAALQEAGFAEEDEFRGQQLDAQEQYETQRMDLEAQYHQEARAWAVQTGEMSEAEYIAELERERQGLVIWQSIYDKKSITYQQLALQILDRDREIHAARMQQARTELAAVDAEIEHTGEGHEQKIALLDELIAGEQNVEIQLGRQQERRQALSAWMDHDLGLLDDERLTLEQQRDLLEQILQKWQAIGDFSAIQGIEKRLRAVNDALRATALTITNVLGGALSGIGSSLVDFFDKAMLRAADWHDFMQSIYAALRHSIAQMAADLVTAQLTAAITPQVATPQVESLLPAGGTGQQFNQGATTFAVAVATLVPALGQWAGAAIGLATSAVTQTQAAGQQVVAAGQNVAAGTQMEAAAGTEVAAGSQMQDASWAMLPAAANILGGALKMQGPASLIYAAAQLIAAAKSVIPFLQHGAVVTRPTLAMLGEAGPEAVIPLDAAAGAAGISIFSPSGAFAEYLSLLADFFEDFIRGTIQWGDLLGHIRDVLRDILGLDGQRGLMAALGLQHGGFVTGPTLAMLGEAGPEVVLPLKPSVPHQFMPSLPSTRLSDFFGREQPGRIPLYITIEHLNLSADSVDELGMRRFARRIGGAIGDELDRALLRMPAIQAGVA